MANKRNGGPAFPSKNVVIGNGRDAYHPSGLTIRDWFAGQALASGTMLAGDGPLDKKPGPAGVAQQMYEIADAMLAEREK